MGKTTGMDVQSPVSHGAGRDIDACEKGTLFGNLRRKGRSKPSVLLEEILSASNIVERFGQG